MGRTLVTGATGFIGAHVARLLVARGDEVVVTVRRESSLTALEGLDARSVRADILDRRAVRRAMRGVERVFHVAGTTNLRAAPADVFPVAVEGTRIGELGWTTSPLEDCLEETIEYYRRLDGDRLGPPGTLEPLPLRLVGDVARRVGL